MKVVKIKEGESKINRKHISKFGETIYYNQDVKSVFIKVCFKDGSSISFDRDEDEDEWESMEDIKED